MIRNYRWFAVLGIMLMALMFVHETAEARRGRSGGGRSFGGSRRSYTAPKSTPRSYSTPRRSTRQPSATTPRTSTTRPRTSFGGTRLSSGADYRKSYGVPRRSEQVRLPNQSAGAPGYTVHRYGGMGDGFMMGYMMGSIPFMWHTPFHPAFYYSRPYVVENTDGSKEVYPPTFSWGKVLLVVVIVGGVAFLTYVIIRNRRRRKMQVSSSSFA